jgi:hypothetical protein
MIYFTYEAILNCYLGTYISAESHYLKFRAKKSKKKILNFGFKYQKPGCFEKDIIVFDGSTYAIFRYPQCFGASPQYFV